MRPTSSRLEDAVDSRDPGRADDPRPGKLSWCGIGRAIDCGAVGRISTFDAGPVSSGPVELHRSDCDALGAAIQLVSDTLFQVLRHDDGLEAPAPTGGTVWNSEALASSLSHRFHPALIVTSYSNALVGSKLGPARSPVAGDISDAVSSSVGSYPSGFSSKRSSTGTPRPASAAVGVMVGNRRIGPGPIGHPA